MAAYVFLAKALEHHTKDHQHKNWKANLEDAYKQLEIIDDSKGSAEKCPLFSAIFHYLS